MKQDKRKHRGPNSKITPKSREFIETESSSSSSECQSDTEEAVKIAAQPPQPSRAPVNTQVHTPVLPCLSSAGSIGTFGGKGLRVKDSSSSVIANGSVSNNSSISGSANGNSSSCNPLSIPNISGPFGTSVPDPGGSGAKNVAPMSPPSMIHEIPLSPLREYQEIQSLWVKIDLSLLNRVPGQSLGERSRDVSEPKDRFGERMGLNDKQKHEDWPGLRDRQKLTKAERRDEESEPDRCLVGDRDRTSLRDREKLCQSVATVLDNTAVPEQSNTRLTGRTDRGDNAGKHSRRQTAGSVVVPSEKHTSKSKRKHKVGMFTIISFCGAAAIYKGQSIFLKSHTSVDALLCCTLGTRHSDMASM